MDGQVVFSWVLQFLPTIDEQLAQYKWNILERSVKQEQNKKNNKNNNNHHSLISASILACL